MGKGEIFTIELVIEAFKKIHIESALLEANANLECLETSPSGVPLIPREADVELDSFCGALDALMKMFSVLGRAFGFVSADVHDKTGILRKLREKANDDGTDPFRGLKPLVMVSLTDHGIPLTFVRVMLKTELRGPTSLGLARCWD